MKILKSSLAVVLLAAQVMAAGPEKIDVTVKGMVCSFCAQGLEKKFKAMPQVDGIQVQLETKIIHLKLKADQTLKDEVIQKTIQDAGFQVEKITRL